ncbi:flagellin, partial [Pseudidiomarina sp. GXY010]
FNGVKVLKEDQALAIQVGANDGEQITVNLQEINANTLGLENFTVGGLSGPITEITTEAAGVTTTAEVTYTSTDLSGFNATSTDELVLRSYDNAGTTEYAIQDTDGKLYNVTASVDEATGVVALGAFDAAAATAAEADYQTDVDAGLTASANPLAALDSALNTVDSLRSELGAIQNRFESAITNLQTNETNLAAARSRIEDADYAVEVANMTRSQILQQAGTSVLAQANQVPQSVLSLLG